jgi:hypothetical protein
MHGRCIARRMVLTNLWSHILQRPCASMEWLAGMQLEELGHAEVDEAQAGGDTCMRICEQQVLAPAVIRSCCTAPADRRKQTVRNFMARSLLTHAKQLRSTTVLLL